MLEFIFEDRNDAGQKLAKELQKQPRENPLIVALPRGGVGVAALVAQAYKTRLELLFVRRIGAPFNQELGVGAVVEGNPPQSFMNGDLVRVLKIDEKYLELEKEKQLAVIQEQQKVFRSDKPRASVAGRNIILIDDGIATGSTVQAALRGLRNEKPKKLTLAVPVAPPDTMEELRKEVDEVVCLMMPISFQAVGQFYRKFPRLENSEVLELLKKTNSI